MHDSSLRKIEAFCRDYLGAHRASALEIVDLGARNVDGMRTYRRFFDAPAWRYRGLDIEPGPNVDLVVADPYRWDGLPESSIDVLISGQTLEHVEFPWLTMEQIARVLRGGGVACLVVPSAGPEHRHPVDCWRFYPDGMRALARHAGLAVVEVFTDWGLGQWQDSFALLQKPRSGGAGDSALPVFEDRKLAERQYRDPQSRGGEVLPGFYAHLDLIEARGGDLAAAAAVLREGLARFPDNAYLRQRQVGVLCALGSPGAALEPALQLLGITPIGPGALRNVELMLRKLNAGEQGYFERGLDTLKPATLGRIGEACFSEQCFTLGSCAWASLLRRRPGELDYRLHRAVALLGTAQRAAGLQALAEAREAQLAEGLVNRTTIVQRIIRRLGAQRYLEIGVERATNFLQIDAPQRVAVDPAFAVPGGVEGIAATRWFAVPSDEFFEQHARTALADGVEVVFIDGLHSYAQVLRDIDNALTHLAPGGVIALHDCLPKNAAEACANEADARRHLEFGNAWTGDVYRAIVHLRANRADLEVFVLDTDHGVGIVRRGAPLSTVEIDIERIAALDFAEFAARREYWLELRPVSFLDEWLERLGVPG